MDRFIQLNNTGRYHAQMLASRPGLHLETIQGLSLWMSRGVVLFCGPIQYHGLLAVKYQGPHSQNFLGKS